MKITESIKQLVALYKDSATAPDAIALHDKKQDLEDLDTLANAQRQTWFVIGLGYFGRGKNITQAAENCAKAGCGPTEKVSAMVIVGDDDARFLSVFNIEMKSAATMIFVGSFQRLSALTKCKQPKA